VPINLIEGAICPEANTMPKVLIADDSRFQAQLLASYLRPKGF
jgi:PleD family two-component response regulator